MTITVTPVAEEPGAPAAPTVVSTDTNAADFELKVIWYAPDDTGDGVDGYNVQYKKTTETSFSDVPDGNVTGTTATITGLEDDTSYQVRVQATDGGGHRTLVAFERGGDKQEGQRPASVRCCHRDTERVGEL